MDSDNDFDKNIQIDNLSPEGFELLCKKLALEWAENNLRFSRYEITYRKYEPIDIVITERRKDATLLGQVIAENSKKEDEHFIECKFYNNSLGLEVLGKTYLMTLRYKPKTLVIATNSALTERAVEFANWLTHELNDFACSVWNPIKNKKNKDEYVYENTTNDSFLERYVKPFIIESWYLYEETIFRKPLIASFKEKGEKTILLNINDEYFLEASLTSKAINRIVKEVYLFLRTNDEKTTMVPLAFELGIDKSILISGKIKKLNLNEKLNFSETFIVIKSSSGEDIIPITNFPKLVTNPNTFSLPDFRDGYSKTLYNKLISDKDIPIFLIHGEGGIGKTYLCEKICMLAKNDGFNVSHTPLTLESEPAFINELLWLLLPQKLRSSLQSEANGNFTTEFLKIFFEHFGGNYNQQECLALRDILTYNKWHENNSELVMSAVARIISTSPSKIVFVLSNCHRMSNTFGGSYVFYE